MKLHKIGAGLGSAAIMLGAFGGMASAHAPVGFGNAKYAPSHISRNAYHWVLIGHAAVHFRSGCSAQKTSGYSFGKGGTSTTACSINNEASVSLYGTQPRIAGAPAVAVVTWYGGPQKGPNMTLEISGGKLEPMGPAIIGSSAPSASLMPHDTASAKLLFKAVPAATQESIASLGPTGGQGTETFAWIPQSAGKQTFTLSMGKTAKTLSLPSATLRPAHVSWHAPKAVLPVGMSLSDQATSSAAKASAQAKAYGVSGSMSVSPFGGADISGKLRQSLTLGGEEVKWIDPKAGQSVRIAGKWETPGHAMAVKTAAGMKFNPFSGWGQTGSTIWDPPVIVTADVHGGTMRVSESGSGFRPTTAAHHTAHHPAPQFPWWILLVIAAGALGYGGYRYQRERKNKNETY